jgi:hypothetical protein
MTLLLDEKTRFQLEASACPWTNSATCGMPGLEVLDRLKQSVSFPHRPNAFVCHGDEKQVPHVQGWTALSLSHAAHAAHLKIFTHQIRRFSRFQAARPRGLALIEALFWVRLHHWTFLTGWNPRRLSLEMHGSSSEGKTRPQGRKPGTQSRAGVGRRQN